MPPLLQVAYNTLPAPLPLLPSPTFLPQVCAEGELFTFLLLSLYILSRDTYHPQASSLTRRSVIKRETLAGPHAPPLRDAKRGPRSRCVTLAVSTLPCLTMPPGPPPMTLPLLTFHPYLCPVTSVTLAVGTRRVSQCHQDTSTSSSAPANPTGNNPQIYLSFHFSTELRFPLNTQGTTVCAEGECWTLYCDCGVFAIAWL
ncbi:hypothetical protein EDB85DRAFT_1628836 [Lactarius pseudohatsudake]|nr:hypothetical protein EDB85DRAFT_1628836 [Lactarius pseudohatsudake]